MTSSFGKYLSVLFLAILLLSPISFAATIRVPSGVSTIQSAIDSALAGDTILVSAGTYAGAGNRDIDFKGKNVMLLSESGPDSTIIDCQGTATDPHRGLRFHSGEDTLSIIRGFTIKNGYAIADGPNGRKVGGAIFCDSSSSPRIIDCMLDSNFAQGGGALFCYKSQPEILNCIITRNRSSNYGGGIGAIECTLLVVNSSISNNVGWWGGGIDAQNSSIRLDSCVLDSNSAFEGGAVSLDGSQADFVYSSINGNSARHGAAISKGIVSIINTDIVANAAEENGAVLYETDGRFVGSVFMDNTAGLSGAIAYRGSLDFTNCTIFRNSSVGGIFYNGQQTLNNCIIMGTKLGELFFGTTPTIECTDILDNIDGDWVGTIADLENKNGNISVDPQFCDTANGELTLWYHSPCLPESTLCGLIGALEDGCSSDSLPIPAYIKYTGHLPGNPIRTLEPDIIWSYLDTLNTSQSSYELEVGEDTDWTVAELWSTGQVSSLDTVVTYEGLPLADKQTYHLRVRISDGNGWGSWRESTFYTRLLYGGGGSSDWPTFQYNAIHTGYNDKDRIYWPLELKWSSRPLRTSLHQPTVVGDRVVISSWDLTFEYYPNGSVVCLDANTGIELWRHNFDFYGTGDLSQPAFHNGLVYFHKSHGPSSNVWACDINTGEIRRKFPFRTQGEEFLSPTIMDNKLVFHGGTYGGLYSYDVVSGEKNWYKRLGSTSLWSPSIYKDTIYTYVSSYLSVHDLLTGSLFWIIPTFPTASSASPAFFGNEGNAPILDTLRRLVVAKRDEQITVISMDSQKIVWKRRGVFTPGWSNLAGIQPSLFNGQLFAVDSGDLVILDILTGDELWKYTGDTGFMYQPVIANGMVFVSSDIQTLGIEIFSKRVVWEVEVGGRIAIANNSLYIATRYGEVFCYGMVPTGVQHDQDNQLPNELTLGQNYPNPFNPTTTIEFSLPKSGYVNLVIYNLLGQEVTTLADGQLRAGNHTIQWDGKDATSKRVASGIYFYRITVDGLSQSKKMLMLK